MDILLAHSFHFFLRQPYPSPMAQPNFQISGAAAAAAGQLALVPYLPVVNPGAQLLPTQQTQQQIQQTQQQIQQTQQQIQQTGQQMLQEMQQMGQEMLQEMQQIRRDISRS